MIPTNRFSLKRKRSPSFFCSFSFLLSLPDPCSVDLLPQRREVRGSRREKKGREAEVSQKPASYLFSGIPFHLPFWGNSAPPPSSRSFRFSLFLLFVSARRRLAWSKTAVARMPVLVRTTLRVFLSVCIFFSLYGVGSFSYFLFLPLWWKGFSWSGGSMSCRAVQGETGQVFLGGKIPPRTCVRSRTQRKGESWLLLSWVPFSMLVCLAPTGFLFATQRTVADRESESGA